MNCSLSSSPKGRRSTKRCRQKGATGTVEESWTSNLAAPGGDDEVITLDVEPGDYGLVCFILSADGTLHALLGMQHELTVL